MRKNYFARAISISILAAHPSYMLFKVMKSEKNTKGHNKQTQVKKIDCWVVIIDKNVMLYQRCEMN